MNQHLAVEIDSRVKQQLGELLVANIQLASQLAIATKDLETTREMLAAATAVPAEPVAEPVD